jgi:hypothetical protein
MMILLTPHLCVFVILITEEQGFEVDVFWI